MQAYRRRLKQYLKPLCGFGLALSGILGSNSVAMAQLNQIGSLTVDNVELDFDLLTPGPTSLMTINDTFFMPQGATGLEGLSFLTRTGTGNYNFQTGAGAAIAALDGSGQLGIIPLNGDFNESNSAQLLLPGESTQFGFFVGDWSGPFNITVRNNGVDVDTFQISSVGNPGPFFVELENGVFDEVILSALPDNPAANWVLPGFFIQSFAMNSDSAAQMPSSLAQVGVQNGTVIFNQLATRLHGIAGAYGLGDDFGYSARMPNFESGFQLAGDSADDLSNPLVVRGQCGSGCCSDWCAYNSEWDGWASGYGIGGEVSSTGGAAGLEYRTGGAQVGLFKRADADTLMGFFGGTSFQQADFTDNSRADVDSGTIGGFIYNQDCSGSTWMVAANFYHDSYRTSRPVGAGTAHGSFDGIQQGIYAERGQILNYCGYQVLPKVALQQIWLHQDAYTETGTGGAASVAGNDTNSLRAIAGLDVSTDPICFAGGDVKLNASGQYMYETLDDSTSATASVGAAPAFTARGVSFGRSWGVFGTGFSYDRFDRVSLYGNYDLYIGENSTFHTADGGVAVNW